MTVKDPAATKQLVLMAQLAAVTAICSQIIIPLPFTPIMINLATMAVMLAGGLLGARKGTMCIVVYILLGGFGVPVFAGFRGGAAVLIGPTGGYIVGYLALAAITGLFASKSTKIASLATGMVLGTAACYTLGTAWFMYLTKRPLAEALMMCVVPFLIGDAIKVFCASTLCVKLKKFI